MQLYDSILPVLEISSKKKVQSQEKIKNKKRNILISPFNRKDKINKIQAYSFFNSIKEKNLKSKEVPNKNILKMHNNENKYKLFAINNYNSKLKETRKNRDLLIVSQILEKITRRVPINFHYFNYYTPGPGDFSSENILPKDKPNLRNIFNNTLKIRSQIIEQKEKEKLYKKNIENKYNINRNHMKSYSRNKKLFINGLKKNPKYFKKKYKSYIKSLSNQHSDTLEDLNKSSYLSISSVRNMNLDLKKLSDINKSNGSIFGVNKYQYIKIRKIKNTVLNDCLKNENDD